MKLAFIDHHLDNFHADTFLRLLRETGRTDLEVVAWESDPHSPDWCERNGVTRAASMLDAADAADVLCLLAPDDIGCHAAWAAELLPLGKPTVFDKILSHDLAEAEQIVALAEAHRTRIFSASALRYAVEVEDLASTVGDSPVTEVLARGFGSWWHYGVHTVSLAQRFLGPVTTAIDTGSPESRLLSLRGPDQLATIDCRDGLDELGWVVGVRADGRWSTRRIEDFEGFYRNLVEHYLRFWQTGEPELSPDELLATVRLLAASDESQAAGGEVSLSR